MSSDCPGMSCQGLRWPPGPPGSGSGSPFAAARRQIAIERVSVRSSSSVAVITRAEPFPPKANLTDYPQRAIICLSRRHFSESPWSHPCRYVIPLFPLTFGSENRHLWSQRLAKTCRGCQICTQGALHSYDATSSSPSFSFYFLPCSFPTRECTSSIICINTQVRSESI